jgi:hypothetical protein
MQPWLLIMVIAECCITYFLCTACCTTSLHVNEFRLLCSILLEYQRSSNTTMRQLTVALANTSTNKKHVHIIYLRSGQQSSLHDWRSGQTEFGLTTKMKACNFFKSQQQCAGHAFFPLSQRDTTLQAAYIYT